MGASTASKGLSDTSGQHFRTADSVEAGSGGPGGGREQGLPISTTRLGVWLLLMAVTMMFVGFTSAYIAQRSAGHWHPIPLPPILWFNTGVLVLSSVALEWMKRGSRFRARARRTRGLAIAMLLGTVFVVGQLLAWKQLVGAGVFIQQGEFAGFFYLLSGVHVFHVLGGLVALAITLSKVARARDVSTLGELVNGITLYWHFVDGLWVYLFAALFLV